ncbi:MAG: ATP-dependent DNA helicase RecG [Gemmatimonadota bacterium]
MSASPSLLRRPVQYLKGVGPRRAERFERLGVYTVLDLLYHVPHRYEDATTVRPIASLEMGDEATIVGRVVSKGVLPTRRGLRIFRAVLKDETGLIECAWPGQPWLERQIARGDVLLAAGPVRFFHGRQLQPREFTVLARGEEPFDTAGKVFPVYPATEGLGHRQIRKIIDENLDRLLDEAAAFEVFGEAWRQEVGIRDLAGALAALHRPSRLEDVERGRRRLAYEEIFFLQLLHARTRARLRAEGPGRSHSAPPERTESFLRELPFALTSAQRRAWMEVESDMASRDRMYRLLQGDVGSGKTVVAIAALLKAVENGCQAALMAPTGLLAEQHYRTLRGWLEALDLEPTLLTAAVTGARRAEALDAVRSGRAPIVVGTHALIQEAVEFADLGLVVIDEQHKFGVEQRRLLRDAGRRADCLVMSATPIPRTLALSLYGDLDLSVLDEMPPGRRPVVTGVRGPDRREAAFAFVRGKLAEGRQAYVVYPLVEESDAVDAKAATAMHEDLQRRFAGLRVGLLHGRLSAVDKEKVMREFLDGEIRVLVATTVIEVGIDVPNATVMLIEDAERFGLAQLHQLRGRVGRGAEQSYCVAFHASKEPPERLRAFASTTDGFEIARQDLRLRGEGNLFGAAQHGVPGLRFADLERDADLFDDARRRARAIVADDPELAKGPNRPLARFLAERYADAQALYGIG